MLATASCGETGARSLVRRFRNHEDETEWHGQAQGPVKGQGCENAKDQEEGVLGCRLDFIPTIAN